MKITPEAKARISEPGSNKSGDLYWTPERIAEARRLHEVEEKTYPEIGDVFKVSGERIRQVLNKGRKLISIKKGGGF